jgi:hypothetical protein
MKDSKLIPTTEEAFAVGKLEGHKEAMVEMDEMILQGATLETLKIYVKAKKNTLNVQIVNNPFGRKP